MKILAVVFLAMFTGMPAEAGPQATRGHFQHASAFRPHLGGTHFIARSGSDFHRHFHYVISPYEPHATISVAGIPHGALVQDPVSNQVFLNP
jgi:hypothetical protein